MNNINPTTHPIMQNTAGNPPVKTGDGSIKKSTGAVSNSPENQAEAEKKENGDSVRIGDTVNDGASVGANVADHLTDSPFMEKLNALLATALVASGIKKVWSGIKEKDRDKILTGSKQTMWGTYHGLHAIETVFSVAMSITPGLRAVGGFINTDLGLTALYKDYKDDKKFNTDKAILHTGAVAWGMRHLTLGVEGLAKTKWMAGLVKGNEIAKEVLGKLGALGAVGAALGIAGGALDAALGVRSLAQGIKTGNKEKKILGLLDMGIGAAMGASCILTGPIGIAVVTAGGAGVAYRTWRTDKDTIKKYLTEGKEKVGGFRKRIADGFRHLFGMKKAEDKKPEKSEK